VAAFVVAVRFFIDSRKRIQEAFPGLIGTRRLFSIGIDRNGFLVPQGNNSYNTGTQYTTPSRTSPSSNKTNNELAELRRQLQQQQKELSHLLQTLSSGGQTITPQVTASLPMEAEQRLHDLQAQLAAKETELQQLRHHEAYAQKLQEQFKEVQVAFDDIQGQMLHTKQHAWQTAELSIQLEQATQACQQLEMALHLKDEKLQGLALENSRLQEACHELETKLAEANLHHQQLQRKAHLLEGLNADIVEMAEAARKLKTGMARAAEMESMLQLMITGEQKK
jgi:chromosome segregation ATPase